jgi:mono/diheme cytochrome c family protein
MSWKSSFLAVAAAMAVMLAASAVGANDLVQGRVYYVRYCASCHGVNADGRGPMAPVLKAQPSDLRKLGQKYGMPLPAAQIARYIDGRADVEAHGSRDMPVWGERFYDIWSAKREGTADLQKRIDLIITYLNSIQQKGGLPPPSPSGKPRLTSMNFPH